MTHYRGIHSCVPWLPHLWHDSFMRDASPDSSVCCKLSANLAVTWLIHVQHASLTCDMTHSCVTWLLRMWQDSFMWDVGDSLLVCDMTLHPSVCCQVSAKIAVTWLIHVRHDSLTSDSFLCDMTCSFATWLIYVWRDCSFMCDMTFQSSNSPSIVGQNSSDMTHSRATWLSNAWHDSFLCDMTSSRVTWLIHMWHDSSFVCDMTFHSPVRCQSSAKRAVTWLIYVWYDSFVWDTTHSCETLLTPVRCDSFMCDLFMCDLTPYVMCIYIYVTNFPMTRWSMVGLWHSCVTWLLTHDLPYD